MLPEAVPEEPDTGYSRVRFIRDCPGTGIWDIRQKETGESGREEMRSIRDCPGTEVWDIQKETGESGREEMRQVRDIRPAESRREEMRSIIRDCPGTGILPADRTEADRLPDIRRFHTDMVLCRREHRRISGMDRGISFIRFRVR